jgi:hypothetical protein
MQEQLFQLSQFHSILQEIGFMGLTLQYTGEIRAWTSDAGQTIIEEMDLMAPIVTVKATVCPRSAQFQMEEFQKPRRFLSISSACLSEGSANRETRSLIKHQHKKKPAESKPSSVASSPLAHGSFSLRLTKEFPR